MAAGKGRSFVLQVGDGATAEAFTTVGGMRSTSMAFNGEQVDITDKDDAGWRALLADAGTKSVSISASGVFKDTASEETVRANAIAQSVDNYRIVYENGDMWECGFQVASLEFAGEHNGEQTFSLTLESSGTLTYTAA